MIVDDDEGVRIITEMMLVQEGYQVVVADTGTQALDFVEKLGDRIDLVFLDFVMPGMDCAQTLRGLRTLAPALPVIIVSGYTANSTLEKLIQDSGSGFIPKPLARHKLLHGIRSAIGEFRIAR